ncbi:outer membrane protein assembly factor BamB [Streptomyces sp. B3I7]|uniref:serine/threonine-protein kinase n=1 Tax=Streptomyces sp. B3I7 TaxID=3042269 RepID=UPI00277E6A49|nr:serine/threonine-protein kinase [Streptomyces sp. B3I7]MDQ0811971.1 outer membrane protein assembly factor BamB [Streptomyces sp. B3I7]
MPPRRNAGTEPEAEHPVYAGQYRLEAELGSGGMGVVHLARSASGLRLAVKVVHAQFAQDPEFRGRFRQEIAAARRVSGAFTASVVDADPEAERPWMATLYIPGPTLAEHVKRNGALPPARLRRLMAGLAEALRDIHRVGVVHRDLKPSNVLLAEDGPKVIDFGISRPLDSELRTETGKLIGTPPFMAPEQFRRPREVGPAADIFALGSVLVHAATGRGPFHSDSPYLVAYQVVHDEADLTGLPDDLAGLVARCLAKEPEDRPTPDEVMTALRSVSASYDTQAFIPAQREVSGLEAAGVEPLAGDFGEDLGEDPLQGSAGGRAEGRGRSAGWSRRPSWVVGGAVAVVLAVVGGGVGVLVGSGAGEHGEGRGTASAAAAVRPWAVRLRAPGVTASGMAHCVAGDGRLYCTRDGVLAAAVDPDDGHTLWVRAGGAGAGAGTPVLSGGLLHVVDAGGKRLTALDPATGRTRWSRDTTRYAGRIAHAGGVVLLTGDDSEVTALDSATGAVKWRHSVPGLSLPAFRVFGDGLAYVTQSADPDGTTVTAVDPWTGAVRARRRMDGALTVVGARGGVVWFTSTDASSYTDAVVRYDGASGDVRRVELRYPLPGAQVVVHGETVYLLASGGAVVAVGTKGTGRQKWRSETSVSLASAPVVAGGRLYFMAADGRLLAVDAERGVVLGQTGVRMGGARGALPGALAVPVVSGGRVVGAAPDGVVFGVGVRDPSGW